MSDERTQQNRELANNKSTIYTFGTFKILMAKNKPTLQTKQTVVMEPYHGTIHKFMEYVPDAQAIMAQTARIITNTSPRIRPTTPNATNPVQLQKLKNFLLFDNHQALEQLVMNVLTYGTAYFEVEPETQSVFFIPTVQTKILLSADYLERGIKKPVGIQYDTQNSSSTSNSSITVINPLNQAQQTIKITDPSKYAIYKAPSLNDTVYGQPRFSHNQPIFNLIVDALDKNLATMKNKFPNNIFFEYPIDSDTAEITQNAIRLQLLYAGHLRSATPMHIPGGASLKEFKNQLDSLQYIDLIKLGIQIIRTAFNYPEPTAPQFLHDLFITQTVNLERNRLQKFLNQLIVTHLGITDYEIYMPPTPTGSTKDIAEALNIATRSGIMTLNEAREDYFNYLPYQDTPLADQPLIRTDRFIINLNSQEPIFIENTNPQQNLENNPIPQSIDT